MKRRIGRKAAVGEVYELEFVGADLVPNPPGPPQPYVYDRIMPQWASVTLFIAGVGALAAGATIAQIGGEANDTPALLAGATILGAGTAGVAAGVIVLTVDEYRTVYSVEHQATLSWVMRF